MSFDTKPDATGSPDPAKRPGGSSDFGSITDVGGISVGHAQDDTALTGCTVVLCSDEGAVAGVDVRGAAPGTRETDLLDPSNLVDNVHAVVLTGGSVFGLDSVCGVVSYLEQRGIGYETGTAKIPIVPAAVIYDLGIGDPKVRPDSKMGYRACQNASSDSVASGRVGVGAGATVGKILGHEFSSPGGLAMASLTLGDGTTIGVLVVVNSFGDIVDPSTGQILAGARRPADGGWLDTSKILSEQSLDSRLNSSRDGVFKNQVSSIENTTLAVVATDAAMTKAQARRVASMAHDGLARAIRPVHTMFDGDTVFALSTGRGKCDVTTLGAVAADLLAKAITSVATFKR